VVCGKDLCELPYIKEAAYFHTERFKIITDTGENKVQIYL
jgi:hypothetical protein